MNLPRILLSLGALGALAIPMLTIAAPPPPSLPFDDEHPGKSHQEAVQAYINDCHATFTSTAFNDGEPVQQPECSALDIEQNCNPDVFGCWGGYETCREQCSPPCNQCQGSCANTCDTCKASCAPGDAACIKRCAEARAGCRAGCLDARSKCTGTTCQDKEAACGVEATKRFRSECGVDKCIAYSECWQSAEDSTKGDVICPKKMPGMSQWCRDICGPFGSFGIDLEDAAPPPALAPDATLAGRCTAAAMCPKDYDHVAPYLAKFCGGALADGDIAALAGEVRSGTMTARTMSLVFNSYGAMYGYEFKKEKWMNGFFYGTGAWLPGECQAKIKAFKSAKDLPIALTKTRDRVKGAWTEVK